MNQAENISDPADYSLSLRAKTALFIGSLLLVAFGQPAWSWWGGLIVAALGFALFWRVLLAIPEKRQRFFVAAGWYAAIQAIQLSWMASHPYLYIYGVILFAADLTGLQFGIISLLIEPRSLMRFSRLFTIAALWTIFEWTRLFWLSGLAFNPVGLTLTGSLYPLQMASLGGVYLLSFWVILTNLLALRCWMQKGQAASLISWSALVVLPYLFGWGHLYYHNSIERQTQESQPLSVLLVQTGFPVEETTHFQSADEARAYVLGEWKQILSILQKEMGKSIDLIVLPEYVVPYGTYHPVFSLQQVLPMFENLLTTDELAFLPTLEEPYATYAETSKGKGWFVTNAFFVQAIANLFKADVVIGLEDSEWVSSDAFERYTAAMHFSPFNEEVHRYEKRVLVPMGEYIPFSFCRSLAAQYGIQGSFTCGTSAKVFQGKVPFGPSICYEEMYGHLMRENRVQGAQLLVNLTSDAWFPDSRLPQQHFDHARLRTVENGIPLVRACNTGVTGAVDSLGRIIKILGEDSMKSQWLSEALYLKVPTYHYQTLYAKFGDLFILSFCLFCLVIGFTRRKAK